MTNPHGGDAGSDLDLAIDRALEAADLRAGGAAETTASVLVEEPSAVESGDAGDGDGD